MSVALKMANNSPSGPSRGIWRNPPAAIIAMASEIFALSGSVHGAGVMTALIGVSKLRPVATTRLRRSLSVNIPTSLSFVQIASVLTS